jgi:type III secretory pathway component EscS
MNENDGWLSSGGAMVGRNKRYIVWFYLLNLILAWFGGAAFREHAHGILDNSLFSGHLVHGFDLTALIEMFSRPEMGPFVASSTAAMFFALMFMLATALFLPGVFQGYASTYRLPREDFFRTCGRNLWRFIRLMIVAGVLMGIVAGVLFGLQGALVKKAEDSTMEVLPFTLKMICIAIVFLVMTVLRIWFDLAEVDVVLSDQRAVRKSIGHAFRHTFGALGRLLASYVIVTALAAIVLVAGLWVWMKLVAPESVGGAFVISQLTLLVLLIPRFWQRGVAVAYWQQRMLAPIAILEPIPIAPVPPPLVIEPIPSPVIPTAPPEPQGS